MYSSHFNISSIFTKVSIGRIFEDILVGIEKGNIVDYVSNDASEVYMFESLPTEKGTNAIEMRLSHNSKDPVPVKISAMTNAQFYIFINIPCIKEVEMFFTSHLKNNKIDISYYAEQAKIQFLKYLNRGIDYMVNPS
jgi:hypothetical protein